MRVMLGESGGGKSMIIKLTWDLQKPDSGEILIDGEEITGLPEEELVRIREKMGVVFQDGALFDRSRCSRTLPIACRSARRSEDTIAPKVGEILSFVG